MRTEPKPLWLDPLEARAWRAYIETQSDLMSALDADLADEALTLGDYQVLVYLSEADDHAMRMCDLADMLQLSPSGLTRRLNGLVSSGWVERLPSTEDRRVMLAVLTETGRTQLAYSAPIHLMSVRRRMIDRLDRDELATLAAAFTKIRDGLAEQP